MGLLKNEKLIVGYDLGNENSQISYAVSAEGEVETLSLVAGQQIYNIPTALCKRKGVNQWFYGKEAVRHAKEQQGILVTDLLKLALDGEPILIEENRYDPVALLTLFFKRSLGLLSQVGTSEKLGALMITCEQLSPRMLEVLNEVIDGLKLKTSRICFQSHTESFYDYMIRQPRDLWTAQSVLFDYRQDAMKIYVMDYNKRTTPVVVYIEESRAEMPAPPEEGEKDSLTEAQKQYLDGALLKLAESVCSGRMISSVFLIGDGFSEEWMADSLRFLCSRGRRVFRGNNLFGKGACHGMQERIQATEAGKTFIFLGKDKLKANIGMDILRQGEDSYLAILDAGINWYEAAYVTEFYVQDAGSIYLKITPLTGQDVRTEEIVLENLPAGISRLRARFYLSAENRLETEIEDLGFGTFRRPSGRMWQSTIELY